MSTRKIDPSTQNAVTEAVDKATKRIDFLLTGVVVVLLVGFVTSLLTAIGPVVDVMILKAGSYQSLRDEVHLLRLETEKQSDLIFSISGELERQAKIFGI